MKIDKGYKIWNEAKKIILGGNMLLSKRPEMHLPEKWPPYYSKASGCFVWDMNNKKYLTYLLWVGTNILGYSNKIINNAVINKLNKGNISSLNCNEEVQLVKRLILIHPWFDMGKLTRTGGEANAVAMRIARASAKNEKVAICGYHGWHDWYLAANLKNKKLNNFLLPGLTPLGVPRKLKDTIFTFNYNDIKRVEFLIKKKNIGIIKMEVMRDKMPENDFLKKIRNLTKKHKVVLIFDECTSGFRETFGGLHKKFKIYPDIAVFGKALGNGYPINAILGKKKFFNKAQESFISSTFWTERLGPLASLKTLYLMERKKTCIYISKLGSYIKKKWEALSKKNGLKINIYGLSSICSFSFDRDHLLYKSFITQEMLTNNILATTSIYVSTVHNKNNLKKYFSILDKLFKRIKEHQQNKKIKLLKGKICHSSFKRLN